MHSLKSFKVPLSGWSLYLGARGCSVAKFPTTLYKSFKSNPFLTRILRSLSNFLLVSIVSIFKSYL
ncbi:hypothetical protein A607_1570 [Helicobacter pylori UMB_G1]|nr:hypothetical protein A607_1570 [Helicobacter pylori UMB_G1]